MAGSKLPHLTPRSLVGRRFAPGVFGNIRIALMGFCPPPSALDRYAPQRVEDQHFIHLSPDSVRLLSFEGRRFLSLAHVYGGPVSSATVEELSYYGVDFILAYGLAGGLGTKALAMGEFYLVEDAYSFDGTTRHYTPERLVSADPELFAAIRANWPAGLGPIRPVRAATGDAIYREDHALLDRYRSERCDIVNLDSAHLYAASRANAEGWPICTIQCGVISDVVTAGSDAASESTLSAMLAAGAAGLNPLERTGEIVRFFVEDLAPALDRP